MPASSADPVATSFQAPAGQNIDNAKADALNNIAQSGAKGQAQRDATAQANAAARTQALQNAMAYVSLRGAPAGNAAASQATVAQPFDQRASVLGLMGQNYDANNQAMQQANTNYMDGIKAGLPIAQTALDRTISNNQAANAAKRDAQAYQLAMKQATEQAAQQAHDLTSQIALARLAAQQQKASAPETLGQFLTRNGGADLVGDQIKSAGDSAKSGALQRSMNDSTISYDQGNDWYGDSVAGTPIPPSLADILVQNSTNKDVSQQNALNRGSTPTPAEIESAPGYASALAWAASQLATGADPSALVGALDTKYGTGGAAAQYIVNTAQAARGRSLTQANAAPAPAKVQ